MDFRTLDASYGSFIFLMPNRSSGRKYGVIQCDPLVLKGLEKTVSGYYSVCSMGYVGGNNLM